MSCLCPAGEFPAGQSYRAFQLPVTPGPLAECPRFTARQTAPAPHAHSSHHPQHGPTAYRPAQRPGPSTLPSRHRAHFQFRRSSARRAPATEPPSISTAVPTDDARATERTLAEVRQTHAASHPVPPVPSTAPPRYRRSTAGCGRGARFATLVGPGPPRSPRRPRGRRPPLTASPAGRSPPRRTPLPPSPRDEPGRRPPGPEAAAAPPAGPVDPPA